MEISSSPEQKNPGNFVTCPLDFCLLVILSVLFPLIHICLRPHCMLAHYFLILFWRSPHLLPHRIILWNFYKIRVLLGILGALKTRTRFPLLCTPEEDSGLSQRRSSSLCPPRSTSGLHSLYNCECVGKGHRSDIGPWYVTCHLGWALLLLSPILHNHSCKGSHSALSLLVCCPDWRWSTYYLGTEWRWLWEEFHLFTLCSSQTAVLPHVQVALWSFKPAGCVFLWWWWALHTVV
jgi:hypothetical protein